MRFSFDHRDRDLCAAPSGDVKLLLSIIRVSTTRTFSQIGPMVKSTSVFVCGGLPANLLECRVISTVSLCSTRVDTVAVSSSRMTSSLGSLRPAGRSDPGHQDDRPCRSLRRRSRWSPFASRCGPNQSRPISGSRCRCRAHSLSYKFGLGLFITLEIVLAHGGTIRVASTGEQGTTFTARFPGSKVSLPSTPFLK